MFPQPSVFVSKGHAIRERIWFVKTNLIHRERDTFRDTTNVVNDVIWPL